MSTPDLPPDEPPEHEWVRRAQDGDPEAVAWVLEWSYGRMLNLAQRVGSATGTPSSVDALVDEGIDAVRPAIRTFKPSRDVPFSSYLHVVARRRMYRALRRLNRIDLDEGAEVERIEGAGRRPSHSGRCDGARARYRDVHRALGQDPVVEAKWLVLFALRFGDSFFGVDRAYEPTLVLTSWTEVAHLLSDPEEVGVEDPEVYWTALRASLCFDEAEADREPAPDPVDIGLPPRTWSGVLFLFRGGHDGTRSFAPAPPDDGPLATPEARRVADRFARWFEGRRIRIASTTGGLSMHGGLGRHRGHGSGSSHTVHTVWP